MKELIIFFSFFLLACTSTDKVGQEIVGSYSLVSWEGFDGNGEVKYPYGPNATGQLIYDDQGNMSMHLEGDSRPELGTDDYELIDSITILNAYKTYFSYYGTYEVDMQSGKINHIIEGCKNPDWKGRKLKRRFELRGDELTIRSDSVIGLDHVLRWQRNSSKRF